MSADIDWESLREDAFAVRHAAYAPYSGYAVGCALLAEDGRVFVGCNVENASYPLCLCAERGAMAQAIAAGVRTFRAVVVAVGGTHAATPCGACRQVLSELAPGVPVLCACEEGEPLWTDTTALLPHAFSPENLSVSRDTAPPPPEESEPTEQGDG